MSLLFMSNTERFNSQRLSRKQALPNRLWRQETPKRSASRSKVIGNKNKIMKMEKTVKVKVSKKNNYVRKTQRSPHNTTQYIIDANSSSSDDTQSLYSEQDRFSYDFQHHMSAGSMMELMGNRFSEMYERMQVSEEKSDSNNQEKSDEPVNSVIINCLDTVSSLAKESQGKTTGDVYNSYLEQADRADTDMQGLVRQLVDTLRQKDQQINALLLKETSCNTEKY